MRRPPDRRRSGRAQVVEHQPEQHDREEQRQRGADDLLRALARELVDLVADHRRLRRGGDEVGRVVVAEHRQGDQHEPRQDPGPRERQRHPPEGAGRARTEIAGRLDLALVDPVERGVERQDQEREVAVGERHDHRERLPLEPAAPRGEEVREDEQPLDPERAQHPGAEAVGREQVDPGEHPHQVVDPEREDQEQEHEPAVATRVARCEVRHRVADQQREHERDRDEHECPHEDGQELLAVPDVLERGEHVADVPVERIPERDRLGERVLVAERDRDDGVEREQEEDGEPEDAREREQAPVQRLSSTAISRP